jgi:CheY-like chemotaxis protein
MNTVVIDDNLMFSMLIEPQLRRLGHQVRTLGGAAGTVDRVVESPPDLLFINLTSTRYDGPALVRTFRAQPETAQVPIIGYAGHVEQQFFTAGLAAGATLVVPNSALRSSLPEVLQKRRSRAGAASPAAQPG